ISLNGQVLSISSARDAIAHGICLVPEDRRHTGLIPEMTLRENISLPSLQRMARLGLVARENEAATAQEMCKRLNVKTPSVEAEARNLSGGNQQKVVLAKWMAMNPKVLIFDEPTRGIDVGAKAEIYKLMRALADEGVAVIMISSDMEEVLGQSDRIAVMHEGAITGILSREEASEEAIMQRAVGRSHTPENVAAAA
ncbi:MAG: ribose transport system ATP-binding protein, partial [Abditibacteriota bacterium]|nr:ribose transport system ATP-binding protein [Abditibacteriota bacterium]